MIQYNTMFHQIKDIVNETKKKFKIKKVPLNYISLETILTQKVKVVFLLCHDYYKKGMYYFAFEHPDDPTVLDEFSEERLETLFRT